MKKSELKKLIKEIIEEAQYWSNSVGNEDDFGDTITDEIIDARTKIGPWALMTPNSWKKYGFNKLGTGFGQRYKKQKDGKWLKIEG